MKFKNGQLQQAVYFIAGLVQVSAFLHLIVFCVT